MKKFFFFELDEIGTLFFLEAEQRRLRFSDSRFVGIYACFVSWWDECRECRNEFQHVSTILV